MQRALFCTLVINFVSLFCTCDIKIPSLKGRGSRGMDRGRGGRGFDRGGRAGGAPMGGDRYGLPPAKRGGMVPSQGGPTAKRGRFEGAQGANGYSAPHHQPRSVWSCE